MTFRERFGFDEAKLDKFLRFAGLSHADQVHVEELHQQIIEPNADSIVNAFYTQMRQEPEFEQIFRASGTGLSSLKQTQKQYLMSLGRNFDDFDYLENRLRIGVIHASVGVSLSLYLAANRLLQQLILDRVFSWAGEETQRQAMVALVLKITTFDMTLVIDTYHNSRVGELQKSVEVLRVQGQQLLRDLSTDALTGVASRRSVLKALEDSISYDRRDSQSVGVIMLDLDNFKRINDRHGHQIGDKVLQIVAGRICSAMRTGDLIGRYGGEEFLMVLPESNLATTRRIAARIRSSFTNNPICANEMVIRITVSQGVTVASGSDDSQSVIERADAALYAAKQSGRDCVMTS